MSRDLEADAQKTVDDLKEVRTTHDLSKVLDDVRAHAEDPHELRTFLEKVKEDMQKNHVLPGLELTGVHDKNIVFTDKSTHETVEFDQKGNTVKRTPVQNPHSCGPNEKLTRDGDRLTPDCDKLK